MKSGVNILPIWSNWLRMRNGLPLSTSRLNLCRVFFPLIHRPGIAQGLLDGGDVCGCEGTYHCGAPLDNRLDGSCCIRPEGKEPVSPAFGIGFSRFLPPFRPLPVSYTHLDVYKRQARCLSCWRPYTLLSYRLLTEFKAS